MSLLEFIITFIGLCLISSFAIYGFYTVSRGEWQLTPDGKYKKTGMIFKYWSLFWEQYRRSRTIIYSGDSLEKKYILLCKTYPGISENLRLTTGGLRNVNKLITGAQVKLIEDLLLCKSQWDEDVLILTTEVPVYDWPEWLQKPISSCPPCMTSVYGTPIWLLFLKLQKDAFSWTNYPITGEISFGLIFLLTLVCIVSFLHKQLKF